MDIHVFKLKFNAPLHIGDERSDYDNSSKTVHSDTFYAALTACIAKVGGTIPNDGDLGFTISSLFPFYQKDGNGTKPVYFLPKSKQVRLPSENQLDNAKALKKVQWLDVHYFQQQLNGVNLFEELNIDHIAGSYMSEVSIPKDFISAQVQNRVAVPRYGVEGHSKDAEPFYMERLFFQEASGLYFLAAEENIGLLRKALAVLSHEGIGTDRTVGNGYFTYEEDKNHSIQFDISPSDKVMNLSLFAPSPKDAPSYLADYNVAYDIKRRGGWITKAGFNTYRKNAVYMFSEGSVLKYGEQQQSIFTEGVIHDLKPKILKENIGHPLWRSGKSLFIPIKTN